MNTLRPFIKASLREDNWDSISDFFSVPKPHMNQVIFIGVTMKMDVEGRKKHDNRQSANWQLTS